MSFFRRAQKQVREEAAGLHEIDRATAGWPRHAAQHHLHDMAPQHQHPMHNIAPRDEDQFTGQPDLVPAHYEELIRPYRSLPLAGYSPGRHHSGSPEAAAATEPQRVQDPSSQQMSDYENHNDIPARCVVGYVEVVY